MITKTLIFVAALLLLASYGYSQNIDQDTIIWHSAKAVSQSNNAVVQYNCFFRTNRGQSVDWVQNDGQVTYHYTITGTQGNWSSVAADGSITYAIALNDITGELTFSNAGGVRSVHLKTLSEGVTDLDYTFEVSSAESEQ